ncbi:MAG: sodium:proton antiporter [Bacteroidetes bacterium GWC2_33_15]|nr:MAG: sodium:proton antiporter [Bacteroidetes bacterium GWA2_33_15]OFX48595.1 MAG: sodium:proton antiporter [Bacteroidetes bacterium GWC2_33_15]OFX64569.1 MAG: sodium:proton antiporter [Bacteroidetes bacterium GWB2_32_14]OFX68013.1 MAG: sodium:proton antiporter [Bacteroidetes bacterium GWD2_33_33]HAN18249.1 sodium:proton antiporter [Bacteroidales bacterium]
MTSAIIITLCLLLLLAYIFDISSSRTNIPSVLLLLLLGWGVNQVTKVIGIHIPDLTPVLPALGSIGLILIVLEGTLDLKLDKSKYKFIFKSFVFALSPMLILSFILAFAFYYFGNIPYKYGLINAIPLSIISSAIAISSIKNLKTSDKEFITYESSLSDILGIIFFNFLILNEVINISSVGYFLLDIIIILIISFIAIIGLALLLSKIKHHVKFLPIILIIILVYYFAEIFHLPALIVILLFGLFLANLDELKHFDFFLRFNTETLEKEIVKFKDLTSEMTFLIRTMFFLLFGFLIETKELLNLSSLLWAIVITVLIFGLRALHLYLLKLPLKPLFYIAPRGLITILLFLSIPASQGCIFINKSLIIQVIILSAFVMMIGLINNKKD